jgi:pyridoxamine 5'-phosphate oxidase
MEAQQLPPTPLELFTTWFHEAKAQAGLDFPNAMALATANADGRPSVRMVLLKEVSPKGFVFFTNYESRKAREITANPFASLCFYWEKLHRSVRVEGRVEKISREDSQEYFDSRPRESRLGAWASPQSREIPSRADLEKRAKVAAERFQGQEKIPLPEHWGGFCLVPEAVEFWINGPGRLHDRFVYRADGKGGWTKARLAP